MIKIERRTIYILFVHIERESTFSHFFSDFNSFLHTTKMQGEVRVCNSHSQSGFCWTFGTRQKKGDQAPANTNGKKEGKGKLREKSAQFLLDFGLTSTHYNTTTSLT